MHVAAPGAQSSNTIVALGERLFLKGYRRLQPGLNPEVEIGRFLTDVAHFAHSIPVAGSVEYVAEDGRQTTLALLQAYVANQGDGWEYTLNYLDRVLEQSPAQTAPPGTAVDLHGGYLALIRTLGRRTAELHAAFARKTGDSAFDPEPILPADVTAWTQRAHAGAAAALDRLERRRAALPEAVQATAGAVLARRKEILGRIDAHATDRPAAAKTRLHGDYHLGQVLLVQNDFAIADFEGEPTRTFAERAQKQSPLKDVAGMLRSFDYAMHSALARVGPERSEAQPLLATVGREWQRQVRQVFLDGYDEVARAHGLALPRGEGAALLDLFLLEKGFYELRYEVDNRPDWVRIPLSGLSDILGS